jgi:DNA-binding response OmpR family regulator
MPKLLIVDDDKDLRNLVLTYARLEGYRCEEAKDGPEALAKIESLYQADTGAFDLIILDVMMPGPDGFETLADIRKITEVPVIMLTSRTEEYDRLFGFHLGADDYVPKPFSPKELMARAGAILKRGKGAKPNGEILFGQLAIHPQARTAELAGTRLNLTPKEYALLLKLVQNDGIVLSREQLLEKVWGYDYTGDTRTVDTHVKSLRERLGAYRRFIHTVWGMGYKFEYREDA